jgi:hypothetical protein
LKSCVFAVSQPMPVSTITGIRHVMPPSVEIETTTSPRQVSPRPWLKLKFSDE